MLMFAMKFMHKSKKDDKNSWINPKRLQIFCDSKNMPKNLMLQEFFQPAGAFNFGSFTVKDCSHFYSFQASRLDGLIIGDAFSGHSQCCLSGFFRLHQICTRNNHKNEIFVYYCHIFGTFNPNSHKRAKISSLKP